MGKNLLIILKCFASFFYTSQYYYMALMAFLASLDQHAHIKILLFPYEHSILNFRNILFVQGVML